jgi:polyhydroxyalkanoate synthesis regulator phasin
MRRRNCAAHSGAERMPQSLNTRPLTTGSINIRKMEQQKTMNHNTREYTTSELVDELVETELLSKKEAEAYVRCKINELGVEEASTATGTSPEELENNLSDSVEKTKAAKRTRTVLSGENTDIEEQIGKLWGAGLLTEDEAEAYVHCNRARDTTLAANALGISEDEVEESKQRAEEKITAANKAISFLTKNTGISIS